MSRCERWAEEQTKGLIKAICDSDCKECVLIDTIIKTKIQSSILDDGMKITVDFDVNDIYQRYCPVPRSKLKKIINP